jgi:hypothetical protein
MSDEKVILSIGTFSSECLACGKGADLNEESHETAMGYGVKPGTKGCGKKYTHVTSMYSHLGSYTKALRPDLEWIDPMGADNA